jgi:hypothetical protein
MDCQTSYIRSGQCGVGDSQGVRLEAVRGKEKRVAYSIEACREGFRMFLYGSVCDILIAVGYFACS